jgi:hypothetical protein
MAVSAFPARMLGGAGRRVGSIGGEWRDRNVPVRGCWERYGGSRDAVSDPARAILLRGERDSA